MLGIQKEGNEWNVEVDRFMDAGKLSLDTHLCTRLGLYQTSDFI